MTTARIGVLGGTSLVGRQLLTALAEQDVSVCAYSRKADQEAGQPGLRWLAAPQGEAGPQALQDCQDATWICLTPIWVLPTYFDALQKAGARKVVALSSTSRFTKTTSSVPKEQALVARLEQGEQALADWSARTGIPYVVLRPTLIYGGGKDGNISEIARLIQRLGVFPLLGAARGKRQPVHAADVAQAAWAAAVAPVANQSYNVSGAEVLEYREMVRRVFAAMGRRPRLLTVPMWVFGLAVAVLRKIPRYRHWTTGMAQRMNQDLVFDHAPAAADLGFKPRPFRLEADDLPA